MSNENRTYELKVEKTIPKAAADVFRAIGEGRLFNNCGADHESLKINFRVGGKYTIDFLSHEMKNCGEFLEIVPHTKIVFTWCQDYDSNPHPDTTVTILLKDVGGQTALSLTHAGFADKKTCDAHEGGWSGGLDDLSQEISVGKLRLARQLPLALDKLYATMMAQAPQGMQLEKVANQKIAYDLKGEGKVTLLFEAEDDKSAWLEVLHEGLATDAQQKSHRAAWDSLLKRVGK